MKHFKSIICALALTALAFALTGCGGGQTNGGESPDGSGAAEYQWRMASTWNEADPQGQGDAFFAQRVGELTDGRVEITVYPSMQLGDPNKVLDSVRQGIIEIAVMAPSSNVDSRFELATFPFAAENFEEANALFYTNDSFWNQYMDDVFSDIGLVRLANIDNDFRGINTFDKPVTKPEDLKGLLIRESGYAPYQAFYAACGASVTTVPFSELYTALEKGLCDAQDNGPLNTFANKFYEAAPYYTYLQQAYSITFDVINKSLYESLPADIQDALKQAGQEAQDYVNDIIQGGYADDILQQMRDAGVNVITKEDIDPADYERFREMGIAVWADFEDEIGSDILQKMYEFKETGEAGGELSA